MKQIVIHYFQGLFSEPPLSDEYSLFPQCFPQLELSDCTRLNGEVSDVEIQSSLFAIGGLKMPGPLGFPALFYQNYWNLCSKNILSLVKDCFVRAYLPEHLNASIEQALVMKQCLDDFCSISSQKAKVRLVNSETVCKSKCAGGLGVKKAAWMNQALLAKSMVGTTVHDGGSNVGSDGEDSSLPVPPLLMSFKDKVFGVSSMHEDNLVIGDGDCVLMNGDIPSIKFSKSIKECLYRPWRTSVIIKLMGRPLTYNLLRAWLQP
ncbi:unnamed protein product [Prunus armeniaca]